MSKNKEIDKAREEGRRDGIVEDLKIQMLLLEMLLLAMLLLAMLLLEMLLLEMLLLEMLLLVMLLLAMLLRQNYQKSKVSKLFLEIGFLFNESEDLKIKVLSDEDVSKTTEKAKDEEQRNE